MREGSASDRGRAGRRAGERGAGHLKVVVWLAVLACLIFVGIKTAPVLFDEFEFQDAVQSAARMGSVSVGTATDIRDGLVNKAQELNIPIKPEDIQVAKGPGTVSIEAPYSVTVDLGVYQWTFHFHPSAKNSYL